MQALPTAENFRYVEARPIYANSCTAEVTVEGATYKLTFFIAKNEFGEDMYTQLKEANSARNSSGADALEKIEGLPGPAFKQGGPAGAADMVYNEKLYSVSMFNNNSNHKDYATQVLKALVVGL